MSIVCGMFRQRYSLLLHPENPLKNTYHNFYFLKTLYLIMNITRIKKRKLNLVEDNPDKVTNIVVLISSLTQLNNLIYNFLELLWFSEIVSPKLKSPLGLNFLSHNHSVTMNTFRWSNSGGMNP